MWLRSAALAALVLAPCLLVRAQSLPPGLAPGAASPVLTLDAAFDRVARAHPDLRLFGPRGDALRAELALAAQRPAYTLGAELENVAGTGQASGVRQAEATFTLASVFERGAKLDARVALAQRRIDALAIQREAARLDLLAETARRYLAMTGARRQGDIAELDIAQRTRTVARARERLQAGASPESVVLVAQAALARAELERARAAQAYASARRSLAALWGERAPAFEASGADPLSLPRIEDADALARLLDATPELQAFAGEQRIREARLQLARSASSADVAWSVGVRRFREGNDIGVVAGVSIPLGQDARAQPGIRAAEAEAAALGIEREARNVSLYATLAEAHGQYTVARLEVARLRDDVMPRLARADAAAERAYRAGATSYLDWAQVQSERTNARRQQLEAALTAQRALIEIQRLTGQPFVAAPIPEPAP